MMTGRNDVDGADAPAAGVSPEADNIAPAARPMGVWRVRLVYCVLVAIVGGHLVEIITQREHWPFSPYQMWSIASTSWEMKDHRLFGVTAEPTPREILLQDPSYFSPLPSRFMRLQMLEGMKELERKGSRRHLDAITRDYLKRYEERRQAGLHKGPPLLGLRMYELTWLMDRDASNRGSPQRVVFFETAGAKGVKTATSTEAEGGDVGPE